MKLNLDCVPCFQRQALQAIRFVSIDEETHEELLRKVMQKLLELKWDSTPPELAREVHRLVRSYTGERDPYERVKDESNREALKLYPRMKEMVEASNDPLVTAARIAIAGNIIDFGATPEYDLEATISEVLEKKFAVDATEKFRRRLSGASTVLYFLDNAGEIVFDRLLVETMAREREFESVDFVVKGGPILNDATFVDAKSVGLDMISNSSFLTITNGDPGTGPARKSSEVRLWIKEHDITISKGQGNYEEMSEYGDIFFLLIAKCPLIARDIMVDVGDIVFHTG